MSGKAEDAKNKVITKALTDAAFKKELLANPNAAIEKAVGFKLPAGVKIKVVEDSASAVHLVLPAAPAKGALSDKELEGVAGGSSLKCIRNTGDIVC